MIRLAISCASSFAVAVVLSDAELDESAVRGLSSRIAPIRRTISGQAMVWMSAWSIKKVRSGAAVSAQ